MTEEWYLIEYAERDGPYNMGLDVALLMSPPDKPVLRLYGWSPPTISLGRFQKLTPSLSNALSPFALTRRTTGGGAIYHGDELTYSVVGSLEALDLTGQRPELYSRMHRAWMAAISKAAQPPKDSLYMPFERPQAQTQENADAFFCFTRRSDYDVVADTESTRSIESKHALCELVQAQEPATLATRKLIGSAQRHRKGVVLQHGSIKVGPSPVAPWALSVAELSGKPDLEPLEPLTLARDCYESMAESLGVRLQLWETPPTIVEQAQYWAKELFASKDWVLDGKRHVRD